LIEDLKESTTSDQWSKTKNGKRKDDRSTDCPTIEDLKGSTTVKDQKGKRKDNRSTNCTTIEDLKGSTTVKD
jgi:hypothetical protein